MPVSDQLESIYSHIENSALEFEAQFFVFCGVPPSLLLEKFLVDLQWLYEYVCLFY